MKITSRCKSEATNIEDLKTLKILKFLPLDRFVSCHFLFYLQLHNKTYVFKSSVMSVWVSISLYFLFPLTSNPTLKELLQWRLIPRRGYRWMQLNAEFKVNPLCQDLRKRKHNLAEGGSPEEVGVQKCTFVSSLRKPESC